MSQFSPRFAVDTRTIAVAFMARTAAMMWLASWISPAQAERGGNLSIAVVEVAGGRAYITPGERAGLRRGDKVRIGRRRFVVLAAGAESALIETRGRRLRPGQRGQAAVREITETEFTRLTPPRPLSDFEDQWPEATRPASEQTPKPVPLGSTARHRKRTRILLAAGTAGQIPLRGRPEPLARGFVRARVHAEPLATLPLALDADLAAQLWLAGDLDRRAGGRSRPPARVYALSAQYGDPGGPQGALGRLRYAATGLGALDGLRVQTPLLRDLSLAAFGGLMPGPLDGAPNTDTARFGAEVVYEDAASYLRPRLSATAHGSRYRGALDERRLMLQADAYPEDGYAGGYALISLFDRDNPWNAPTTELTAAGAHGGIRLDAFHAGARVDLQRPERSLWLAAFVPPTWLCITRPAPPSDVPETCYGDEARYLFQGDVGLSFERVSLDLGATATHTAHADAHQRSAFAHLGVRRILERVRADATVSASDGSLFRSLAVSLSAGVALGDALDASVRYRPAIATYSADVAYFVEHTFGASLRVTPLPGLDISLDANSIHGRDVQLMAFQLMTIFRDG